MKTIKVLICLFLYWDFPTVIPKKFELLSPNGAIKASIALEDKIYYSVNINNEELASNNHLALILKNETLGLNPKVTGSKTGKVKEEIKPIVPLKFSSVSNNYNYLVLNFKGDYAVEFRAFDDGIAYRFITAKKGEIEVLNEDFSVNFPEDYLLHLQQPGGFKTAYEEAYSQTAVKDWKPADKMAVLPVLVDSKSNTKY